MSSLAKSLEKFIFGLVSGTPPNAGAGDNNVVTIDKMADFKDDLNDKHVIVQDLVEEKIYFNSCPVSLKLSNLKNCKLICGPVQGSIVLESCKNCVFFLCAQQVRIRNSESLDLYVRVKCRSTLEDSTDIRFAPYEWDPERNPTMKSLAHFDQTVERFDLIEDFNWLAFSTASPNWGAIPKEDRAEFPETELPETAVSVSDRADQSGNEQEDLFQFLGTDEPVVRRNKETEFAGGVFPA